MKLTNRIYHYQTCLDDLKGVLVRHLEHDRMQLAWLNREWMSANTMIYVSCVFLGYVAVQGNSTRLQCPHGYSRFPYSTFFWYLSTQHTYDTQIVSYVIFSDVRSLIVLEPWKSRGWTLDTTNGDLVIPKVVLSDESTYSCGGTSERIIVNLDVYGKYGIMS